MMGLEGAGHLDTVLADPGLTGHLELGFPGDDTVRSDDNILQ